MKRRIEWQKMNDVKKNGRKTKEEWWKEEWNDKR